MAEPTTYLLTAHRDLKYRLKELPTESTGYVLKRGATLHIVSDVLGWLKLLRLDTLTPANQKDFTLEKCV